MATEEGLLQVSAVTGADLSASSNLFRVVKLDTNGNVVLVAAITDVPFGILQDVKSSGKVVPVATGGIVKAVAGATIAAGTPVACKADGSLQAAVSTQYVIGVARVAAVSGDVFSVMIDTSNPGIKA